MLHSNIYKNTLKMFIVNIIPGQSALSGQPPCSISVNPSAVHKAPEPDGAGLEHVRNLDLHPSPQVVEHVDHEPQSLQPPSTTRNEIIHIENTK